MSQQSHLIRGATLELNLPLDWGKVSVSGEPVESLRIMMADKAAMASARKPLKEDI
jgi:hypothetical protein